MLRVRIIPALLLKDDALVKTVRFKNPGYIGDPINTVRIFNELEVDELTFLDISASPRRKDPNFRLLREIADECFMPLSYGGGIRDFDTAARIFDIGFEKVVLNTITHENPQLITRLANHFGSQAVIVSIDVKKNFWGSYEVVTLSASKNTHTKPDAWAKMAESLGAGEILLTSVDREGTWSGFDVELTKRVSEAVDVPVIAHGGAGSVEHIGQVVRDGKASAVALGSMVVYQKKDMGVLVNFPDREELSNVLS